VSAFIVDALQVVDVYREQAQRLVVTLR